MDIADMAMQSCEFKNDEQILVYNTCNAVKSAIEDMLNVKFQCGNK